MNSDHHQRRQPARVDLAEEAVEWRVNRVIAHIEVKENLSSSYDLFKGRIHFGTVGGSQVLLMVRGRVPHKLKAQDTNSLALI